MTRKSDWEQYISNVVTARSPLILMIIKETWAPDWAQNPTRKDDLSNLFAERHLQEIPSNRERDSTKYIYICYRLLPTTFEHRWIEVSSYWHLTNEWFWTNSSTPDNIRLTRETNSLTNTVRMIQLTLTLKMTIHTAYRFSVRQSRSTTVIFRTSFTMTTIFYVLIKWAYGF